MSPQSERRQHARIPVQWPTVFITSQFFGHGEVAGAHDGPEPTATDESTYWSRESRHCSE